MGDPWYALLDFRNAALWGEFALAAVAAAGVSSRPTGRRAEPGLGAAQ